MTGATAGIGRDFALQLAGAGFNVFLASRTASKLQEISDEIGEYSSTNCRGVQELMCPYSRQVPWNQDSGALYRLCCRYG